MRAFTLAEIILAYAYRKTTSADMADRVSGCASPCAASAPGWADAAAEAPA